MVHPEGASAIVTWSRFLRNLCRWVAVGCAAYFGFVFAFTYDPMLLGIIGGIWALMNMASWVIYSLLGD